MKIRYAITDKLELPKDLVLGAMNISLQGKYEAYIENYKSIAEYTNEKIDIRGKNELVTIIGDNLKIDYFTKTDMIIKGRVEKIFFG